METGVLANSARFVEASQYFYLTFFDTQVPHLGKNIEELKF
jgi:hypothetical protein